MIKITADEMKKISNTSCAYTEEEIEKEIRNRAEHGFSDVVFEMVSTITVNGKEQPAIRKIPDNIIKELKSLGFKVKYDDIIGSSCCYGSMRYYRISWD